MNWYVNPKKLVKALKKMGYTEDESGWIMVAVAESSVKSIGGNK